MSYQERVVFITGASSGIGEALAEECSRQGAAVVITARRLDRLEALEKRLKAEGRAAMACQVDVNSTEDLEKAIAATVTQFGRLDVMVANAGFGVAGSFEKLTPHDYRRQMETNVFGVLATLRAGLPELKKTHGRFAIMGSVAGYLSVPGSTAYSMSKFAIRAFAEGARPELARQGVSLTLLTPGFVVSEIRQVDNSGQHDANAKDPIPRFMQMAAPRAARQMAAAIARRKPEVIITGHGKVLVSLVRYFPGFTRFLLSKLRRGENKALLLTKGDPR